LHGKKACIFTAFLMLFMAAGIAEEERTDASGQWKYVLEGGDAVLTGYVEEPSGDLVIPDELDGYPVTVIGDYVFSYCRNITSVVVPDGVTSIGDWAFRACVALTSVIIPDSVLNIGDAFSACIRLVGVTLPDSVLYIGDDAFDWCDKIVLSVTEGSYAEQYAKENEISYEYIVE
jgi:hypothetical protein